MMSCLLDHIASDLPFPPNETRATSFHISKSPVTSLLRSSSQAMLRKRWAIRRKISLFQWATSSKRGKVLAMLNQSLIFMFHRIPSCRSHRICSAIRPPRASWKKNYCPQVKISRESGIVSTRQCRNSSFQGAKASRTRRVRITPFLKRWVLTRTHTALNNLLGITKRFYQMPRQTKIKLMA